MLSSRRRSWIPGRVPTAVYKIQTIRSFQATSRFANGARVLASRGFSDTVTLPADSNQALGLGQYAKDFIGGKYGDNIDPFVWERIEMLLRKFRFRTAGWVLEAPLDAAGAPWKSE